MKLHPLQQHPPRQHRLWVKLQPMQQHSLRWHPLQQHPLRQHPLQMKLQPLQQHLLRRHPLRTMLQHRELWQLKHLWGLSLCVPRCP
mmetsp:Transcript_74029/g.190994  ORF Transcript_74029/g.190994 Transcript_74029/m.190994 type:complete len:87 (-) Transcript_74029:1106-1366(-)